MYMMDGEWVKTAMSDDGTMTAQLLEQMSQSPMATPPPPTRKTFSFYLRVHMMDGEWVKATMSDDETMTA